MGTDKKKKQKREIPNKRKMNNDVPFERQVMWVLRNYDKMVVQNHLLRHYLEQIPVSIVDDYNLVARENGRLMKVVRAQEKEMRQLEKKVARLQDDVVQYKKQTDDLLEQRRRASRLLADAILENEKLNKG